MRMSFEWLANRGMVSALILGASIGFAHPQHGVPPVREAETNNLSYPAVHTTDPATTPVWNVSEGVLGVDYSYGCNKPEIIGTTTYPNTSCVDSGGNALPAELCTMCEGIALDRIYWQKVAANDWWAQSIGPSGPQQTSYVDWSDSMESVTWKTTSNIRVETTPFAVVDPTLLGYQMWHVFGQGPDEQWGVRTTDDGTGRPYQYQSPYGIIHTSTARLNIAKLEEGASTCPTAAPPGGSGFVLTWTGSSWEGVKQLRDIPYTAELNVGGKYVYGYNWTLRRDSIEPWSKAGWWRLTFYTSDNSVLFDNPGILVTPPPAVPGEPPALPPAPLGMITAEASRLKAPGLALAIPPVRRGMVTAEADTGMLYVPVIDAANKLTYIDMCIAEGASGSGNGGRGK